MTIETSHLTESMTRVISEHGFSHSIIDEIASIIIPCNDGSWIVETAATMSEVYSALGY
jgi:hypothetical protein